MDQMFPSELNEGVFLDMGTNTGIATSEANEYTVKSLFNNH